LVRKSEEPKDLIDRGVDGITILKWILKPIAYDSVDWIQLAQEWVNSQVVLKGAMNHRLSQKARN
jgi:aryl carrier-like protein